MQTEEHSGIPGGTVDGPRAQGFPFDWRLAASVSLVAVILAAVLLGPGIAPL